MSPRDTAEQALAAGRSLAEALSDAEAHPDRTCAMCGYNPDAPVGARWEFTIPQEVQSLNARKVNGGTRAQQARYREDRETWEWWMRDARLRHKIPRATGKRRLTLTRLYGKGQRELDADNLAGMKMITDSVVREGLLVDDKPKHAEVHYRQERAADGVSALRVRVEELI